MGTEFVRRVIRISGVIGLVGALFVSQAFGYPAGWGFLAGAGWMTLNLWLLRLLAGAAFGERPSRGKAVALLIAKFPLLYGGGFLLVVYGGLNLPGALAGVSVPLLVASLKAGGLALQARRGPPPGSAESPGKPGLVPPRSGAGRHTPGNGPPIPGQAPQ